MPLSVQLYDIAGRVILLRNAQTAAEAVANDPKRYSLTEPTPWPPRDEPSAPAAAAPAVSSLTGDRDSSTLAGADGPADDLERIDGIGPGLARQLVAAGFNTYADLAGASPEAINAAIATPGYNAQKIVAQRWREQAAELAGLPTA